MKTKSSIRRRRAKAALLLYYTATLLAAAPAVWAESPSDLMEQGIYSEETKGDLGAAVQLYQKVVEQGKADQALAARAQYHLGVCYYKQQNFTAANAAFETVVKDFPDQKEVVALARKYLAGVHPLQPAPWTDGEDMRIDLRLEAGMKIGVADYMVNAGQTASGQKIWRFTTRTSAGGMQSISRVEADAETMSPLHSRWKHALMGEVDAIYSADHADLTTTGKDGVKTIHFDTPVLDNEEAVEWMRRLPFSAGVTNNQPLLASLTGMVIPIQWAVSGPDQVQVPAGTFNCYKVQLSINQTFWYSSDAHRTLVKFEAGGAVGELSAVTHKTPGEIATFTDANSGISLTAPASWSFDKEESDAKGQTELAIIDPEGLSVSSLTLKSLDTLTADEKKPLRDYANLKIEKVSKLLNDFQVRTDSWKNLTVAGQPAVSVVADFTQMKAKKVIYSIWTFGTRDAAYFEMITSAKDFAALQPKMDVIISSLKLQ